MVLLPMDVINYILSFLPVKDPTYDNCMDQILYFKKMLEEKRGTKSQWITTSNYYNKMPFWIFILHHNRMKMELKQKKINPKEISNTYNDGGGGT